MSIRDHVVLLVNGQRRDVHGGDCFLTLAEYLRQRLGLVGTKVVCSEGDCGSCTVLVGRPVDGGMHYLPIDSCIRFLFQLDGAHVVTVEGLAHDDSLTPVQQAMVECHGSQCGYCTPGFVMAMTAIQNATDEQAWRHGLTGNLCRCTGYTPIVKAGQLAAVQKRVEIDDVYPPHDMANELRSLASDSLDIRGLHNGQQRHVFCPTTIRQTLAFRSAQPGARVIAGATDVGVLWNKRVIAPDILLDLNRVAGLRGVHLEHENEARALTCGARTTWTELYRTCQIAAPQFAEIIGIFGSPQIRHVGTIGGNIVNASPIADSLPFLYVMEAELELVSVSGVRHVNINDFYRGYKQLDLRPDELLARVRIPLPDDDERLRLYKVSRRRDLDIATFTAALRLRLECGNIAHAALAYGAVGPTVIRLRETEAFLQGRPFEESTMRAAGDIAVREIAPISDVRGSAQYRRQLARNVLLKFFHEQAPFAMAGG